MSTVDLAANSWSHAGATPTHLDSWLAIRFAEPIKPRVQEDRSKPESSEPEKPTLPDNFWQDWFGLWD